MPIGNYEAPVLGLTKNDISDYASTEDWEWFCNNPERLDEILDAAALELRDQISDEMIRDAISTGIRYVREF